MQKRSRDSSIHHSCQQWKPYKPYTQKTGPSYSRWW